MPERGSRVERRRRARRRAENRMLQAKRRPQRQRRLQRQRRGRCRRVAALRGQGSGRGRRARRIGPSLDDPPAPASRLVRSKRRRQEHRERSTGPPPQRPEPRFRLTKALMAAEGSPAVAWAVRPARHGQPSLPQRFATIFPQNSPDRAPRWYETIRVKQNQSGCPLRPYQAGVRRLKRDSLPRDPPIRAESTRPAPL